MFRRSINALERHAYRRHCKLNRRSFAVVMKAQENVVDSIRNVAIVAHVDHGKTTLVDQLLKHGGLVSDQEARANARVMDSSKMEQERGITILSKCTSVDYKGTRINIIDTPGHQDFGGEVERILSMVDSVCLLTDVGEGPKPQTKFILEKALLKGFQPIIVLNKVDRAEHRVEDCQLEVMELLEKLGASSDTIDECMEHTVYSSAKNGWATLELSHERQNMEPLLEKLVSNVPPPIVDKSENFRMLASILERDEQHGRLLVGKIHSGSIKLKDTIHVINRDGKFVEKFDVKKIFIQKGTEKILVKEATSGEIVRIGGALKATVTDTIGDINVNEALKADAIDPPLVSFLIRGNDSPLRGQDGTKILMAHIVERLEDEANYNPTIKIFKVEGQEAVELAGRGELQLSVILENMRREGFEFTVAPPRVKLIEKDGATLEPFEIVTVDCEEDCGTAVIETFSAKMAEVLSHDEHAGRATIRFRAPSRALIGCMQTFRVQTRGTGIMEREFDGYADYLGNFRKIRKGAMVAMNGGKITGYALTKIQNHGRLFIKVGDTAYDGMVVGEAHEMRDFDCNPCKEKQDATQCRDAVGWAQAGILEGVKRLQFEEALDWIEEDELIEVTPTNIRIRKGLLSWKARHTKTQQAKAGKAKPH